MRSTILAIVTVAAQAMSLDGSIKSAAVAITNTNSLAQVSIDKAVLSSLGASACPAGLGSPVKADCLNAALALGITLKDSDKLTYDESWTTGPVGCSLRTVGVSTPFTVWNKSNTGGAGNPKFQVICIDGTSNNTYKPSQVLYDRFRMSKSQQRHFKYLAAKQAERRRRIVAACGSCGCPIDTRGLSRERAYEREKKRDRCLDAKSKAQVAKAKAKVAKAIYARSVGNKSINVFKTSGGGGWGGKCECPNGQTYMVGDAKPHCQTLACQGGKMLSCNRKEGAWSNNSVVCGKVVKAKKQAIKKTDTSRSKKAVARAAAIDTLARATAARNAADASRKRANANLKKADAKIKAAVEAGKVADASKKRADAKFAAAVAHEAKTKAALSKHE